MHQLGAGVDADLTVHRVLQLRNLVHEVTVEHRRVVPAGIREAGRDNEFGQAVHPVRHLTRAVWVSGGEELVATSAQQQRLGATHVVDSTSATFQQELTEALAETGATIAFDAIGGGRLASQILGGMEAALVRKAAGGFSRYGSTTHKQVYIYGGLDTGPTELVRSYGMAWGLGGWLLTYFIQQIGPAEAGKLRQRVADEIKTTFASHYTAEIGLTEALKPEVIAAYNRKSTGEKYLINPAKG